MHTHTGPQDAYYAAYTATDNWHAETNRIMAELADTGHAFTSDDVRARTTTQPPHPNAWGGLYRIWKNDGRIKCIGYRPSITPSRRGAITRVWQGTTARKPA